MLGAKIYDPHIFPYWMNHVYTIRFTISLVESMMYGLYIPLDSWFTYSQHWINDVYGIYTIRFMIHIFSPIGSMVCGFSTVNSIICIFSVNLMKQGFSTIRSIVHSLPVESNLPRLFHSYIYNLCSIPSMLQTQLS